MNTLLINYEFALKYNQYKHSCINVWIRFTWKKKVSHRFMCHLVIDYRLLKIDLKHSINHTISRKLLFSSQEGQWLDFWMILWLITFGYSQLWEINKNTGWLACGSFSTRSIGSKELGAKTLLVSWFFSLLISGESAVHPERFTTLSRDYTQSIHSVLSF